MLTAGGKILPLALGYAAFTVYVSILPMADWSPWDVARERLFFLQPVEFRIESRSDLLGNIILFIPTGFLFGAAVVQWLTVRGVIGYCLCLLITGLAGLLTSVCAEALQAFLPFRTSSWTDVTAQIFGCFLGTVLAGSLTPIRLKRSEQRLREIHARNPVLLLSLLCLASLMFASLMPFDVVLNPAEIYGKWKNGHILVDFSHLDKLTTQQWLNLLVTQGILVLPLGPLIFIALVGEGFHRRRALLLSLLLGCLVAASLEIGQIFIVSRTASLLDAIVSAVAIVTGTILAAIFSSQPVLMGGKRDSAILAKPRVDVGWLIFWLLYVCYLLYEKLRPFQFEFDRQSVHAKIEGLAIMPFLDYVSGSSDIRLILDDVLKDGLFFVPLGLSGYVFLNRLLKGRSSFLASIGSLLVGLSVAGEGEIGQLFLPSRTPDITDVCLGVLGACVGTRVGAWYEGTKGEHPSKASPISLNANQL
ncbi:MAG: VanZ family protein [Deltaproteobacteria bacterium]|nr:VanZ family protein [Deltaproteobacteria bacterium]